MHSPNNLRSKLLTIVFLLPFLVGQSIFAGEKIRILETKEGAGRAITKGEIACIHYELRYSIVVSDTAGDKIIDSTFYTRRGHLVNLDESTEPQGLVEAIAGMKEREYRHVRMFGDLARHTDNPQLFPLEARITLLEILADQKDGTIRGCKPLEFPEWFAAARSGDVASLKTLRNQISDLEVVDNHKESALAIAARHGRPEVVKYLVEEGANVKAKNEYGYSIDKLAEKGAVSRLGGFAEGVSVDSILALLDSGYDDVENLGRLTKRVFRDSDKAIRYYESLKNEVPAVEFLKRAVSENNIVFVKYLVNKGANPNATLDRDGIGVIHEASINGNYEIIKVLAEAGGSLSVGEYTPLYYAIRNDNIEVVKYLLENGATKKLSRWLKDTAPIHLAAENGAADTVEYLLSNGEQVNLKNSQGDTPLHLAVRASNCCDSGYYRTIKSLLKHGADTTLPDSTGKTAVELAGHVTIIELIQEH